MKRLGIFLFNNQRGIIEDYIRFLLDDITPNLSHLCIIANNKLDEGTAFEYTKDIFVNNEHEDIDIWRDVLVNHIGFNQLIDFDEVILFDDSFYGPIYSFDEIFNRMDNVNSDLWTILSNGLDDELNKFNFQFIAFKKSLIESDEFKEIWMNMNNN